ncbi:hypothetical protein JJB07_14690 [Tumebacillus sp. ITR2]|uniref:Uncharacterized protein n=1 Tax=Tumebacillus amylolyticus TaxID=2801339 RepID=A0ABS1JC87_9BACL|nr:hypothetical protein [Tumebacillus amylolyticus]MBL0387886.1 hypothetical protein [Tumebacillus amylolyticus]
MDALFDLNSVETVEPEKLERPLSKRGSKTPSPQKKQNDLQFNLFETPNQQVTYEESDDHTQVMYNTFLLDHLLKIENDPAVYEQMKLLAEKPFLVQIRQDVVISR